MPRPLTPGHLSPPAAACRPGRPGRTAAAARAAAPLLLVFGLVAAGLLLPAGGCIRKKPPAPVTRYQPLPGKDVPPFLRGTIFERSDVIDLDPLVVSGFGLVVNLDETGDNTQVPTPVREYMVREMVKRGFGSKLMPGFERTMPEDVLRDPRTAIVRVDALVPPGARRGDFVDVRVSALPASNTTSVARGELYRTELKVGGANPMAPGKAIDVIAMAQGPVLVNPAYALATKEEATTPPVRRSLRTGWVLDGGQLQQGRPLVIRIRQPERRVARLVEGRIENHFASYKESQRDRIAAAEDEAIVRVTMPSRFRGDWNHFAGVLTHLYFDSSPSFVVRKSQELAAEAVKPDAPLLDISFCWEGLGEGALPFITPLITHERPEVAFAAARAAAFLNDPAAPVALAGMARTNGHPFQLNAVQALGSLRPSPVVAGLLRQLLDVEQTSVRVEAYRVLAKHRDPAVISRVIDERFVLDIVPAGGAPLIYASRTGMPRIALIGPRPSVQEPFSFTAMDDRLTLVGNGDSKGVTIFYRSPRRPDPAKLQSRPDLAELIGRLGGDRAAGPAKIRFNYGDVVAIVQGLSDRRQIVATAGSQVVPATFMLQPAPAVVETLLDAPVIPDLSRPTGDNVATIDEARIIPVEPGAGPAAAAIPDLPPPSDAGGTPSLAPSSPSRPGEVPMLEPPAGGGRPN